MGESQQARPPVLGDNPITSPEDDLLGRSAAAISFAEQIQDLDASNGAVVGVLGPWGSGKTSFINLARCSALAAGSTVIDFNPWMFSGCGQLVDAFFAELAAQFKLLDMVGLGNGIEEFGTALSGLTWLPLFGGAVGGLGNSAAGIGRFVRKRKGGVEKLRCKLAAAMQAQTSRLFVVLDDVDRLSTAEIRDIFRLVRLTASLPNLVYVLAFDRARVELALSEDGVPGRAYLEKILQLTINLPAIPPGMLSQQTLSALDTAMRGIENAGGLGQDVWPDVYYEIVRPLIRNMRDVRRYTVSVRGAVRALAAHIELADVLALEAVRVFLPDAFDKLHDAVEGLTTPRQDGPPELERPDLKKQVDAFLRSDTTHPEVLRSLVMRLFPAAQYLIDGGSTYGRDWMADWLKSRRVAHEDILRLYLERVAGVKLCAFTDAERGRKLLSDREALSSFFENIEPARFESIVAQLENWESDFRPVEAVPTATVLLNLIPKIPSRDLGMFDLGPNVVISRVVFRLLSSIGDIVLCERACSEILPKLTSLSSKLRLVEIVGHRQDIGHKLVSETAASIFERDWRAEVRSATPDQLLPEWDLLRVLYVAEKDAEPGTHFEICPAPEFTLALLRAAQSPVSSQSMGSRVVQRQTVLRWDVLKSIYGDESTLRTRVNEVVARTPEDSELLSLAQKYLAGQPPDNFGTAWVSQA